MGTSGSTEACNKAMHGLGQERIPDGDSRGGQTFAKEGDGESCHLTCCSAPPGALSALCCAAEEADAQMEWPYAHYNHGGGPAMVLSVRNPRRAMPAEDWIVGAADGHAIELVTPCPMELQREQCTCALISSTLYIDTALLTLTVHPIELREGIGMTILVDSLEDVAALSDVAPPWEYLGRMSLADQARAVILRLVDASDGERKHICFLEGSERTKDRCIQELRVLWLEKRRSQDCKQKKKKKKKKKKKTAHFKKKKRQKKKRTVNTNSNKTNKKKNR
eukprot:NODE_13637_length_1155_cov_3.098249.p1 GENE.NODE_13637_length_1155_cov_3.098249~~NODE_13637_length_1155_cov_3.098249.p1  ORF type:complete len:278 (-),score=97.26 NODE_13637_length_1155_cov_3.098249:73-906(-)